MPINVDFDAAVADPDLADQAYRQKLAKVIALAKATLAARPEDVGTSTGGPNQTPTDPNDPKKGQG